MTRKLEKALKDLKSDYRQTLHLMKYFSPEQPLPIYETETYQERVRKAAGDPNLDVAENLNQYWRDEKLGVSCLMKAADVVVTRDPCSSCRNRRRQSRSS